AAGGGSRTAPRTAGRAGVGPRLSTYHRTRLVTVGRVIVHVDGVPLPVVAIVVDGHEVVVPAVAARREQRPDRDREEHQRPARKGHRETPPDTELTRSSDPGQLTVPRGSH